ncbi:MAG: PD-(D/E)XK nuclease family protein, partial [Clostridia bacterium]|nr:PD-(D/E)XK nuclease family protein [Clostridia bacterium]
MGNLLLLCGRAGSGKTRAVTAGIQASQVNNKRVFLIVPRQVTHTTERQLIAALGSKGLWRCEVLSPQRLCSRILAKAGLEEPFLNQAGQRMLLTAAARALSDKLTVYKRAASRPAFAEAALCTLRTLKRHDNTLSSIMQAARALPEGLLRAKTMDLALLLEAMETGAKGYSWDASDGISAAIALLERPGNMLEDCDIYIEEWDALEGQMLRLLRAICRAAANVTVSVCTGPYDHERNKLVKAIETFNLPIRFQNLSAPAANTPLKHVERYAFSMNNKIYTPPPHGIRLYRFEDAETECHALAHAMAAAAKEKGWRWRDMAVVCCDPAAYDRPLRRALQKKGIPFFTDSQADPSRHPVLRGALLFSAAMARNFSLPSVLEALHGGFWPLFTREFDSFDKYRDAVEEVAVYLTHMGRHGLSVWKNQWTAYSKLYDLKRLNTLRSAFGAAVLAAQDTDMETIWLNGGLEIRAETMAAHLRKGDVRENALAAQCAGAVDLLRDVLRQMKQAFAGAKLSCDDFHALLSAGLSSSGLGVIPPMADQALVARAGYTFIPHVKAVFLVGASEKSSADRDGLFTDDDIAALKKAGCAAGASAAELCAREDVTLYRILSCPQTALWVSWSAERAGTAAEILGAFFPALNDAPAYKALPIPQIKQKKQQEQPPSLPPQTISALLGGKPFSVSRLERFAACPYGHTLDLFRAREEAKPRPPARHIGTLLHEAIEVYVKNLPQNQREIDKSLMKTALSQAIDRNLPQLDQTQEGRFTHTRLARAMQRACLAAHAQLHDDEFRP